MLSSAVIAANTTVNVIAVGLIVLGVVLFVVTIAFWRGAVEDPSVLAPLEIMQDRKFARADVEERVLLLNEVRAADAPAAALTQPVSPLMRAPLTEPNRPFRDPYPHDDDAVDLVRRDGTNRDVVEPDDVKVVPAVIDPLLNRQRRPRQ